MKYILMVLIWVGSGMMMDQPSKRGIVLIDGIAFVVEMSDKGAILARFKKIDDYFETSLSDEEIVASIDPNVVIDRTVIDFYLDDASDEDGSADPIPPALPEMDVESESSSQYVSFALNRAVLNTQAVHQIRKISQTYLVGQIDKIEILSFHKGDRTTRLLAQNRSKAISDLLQTFGVNKNAILINVDRAPSDANLAFVNISLSKSN